MLPKKNGLYYCPIDTVAADTSPVRSQISQTTINAYIDKFSADIGNNEHIPSSTDPFPLFCPCLPSISDTTD